MRYRWLWISAGCLSFLAVWELLSLHVESSLILPGPVPVLERLAALSRTPQFLEAVFGSLVRVLFSLALAIPLSLSIGIAAALSPRLRSFLQPLFTVIASTPVLSIILIVILWFGPEFTPIFTAFLMIFPVMSSNVIQGILSVDQKLLEVASVYRLSTGQRLRHLYLPSISPYLLAALRSSLSLSWKVVVAAEVIAQPLSSLGERMQSARMQLETAELFAWTVATVLLAALTEALPFIVQRIVSRRDQRWLLK